MGIPLLGLKEALFMSKKSRFVNGDLANNKQTLYLARDIMYFRRIIICPSDEIVGNAKCSMLAHDTILLYFYIKNEF